MTRIRGDKKGWTFDYFVDEKERLRNLASDAGFRWLDIAELGREAVTRGHSMFAGLPLFIDRVHLSPKGSGLVARSILAK